MVIGWTNSHFHVNSASGLSPDALVAKAIADYREKHRTTIEATHMTDGQVQQAALAESGLGDASLTGQLPIDDVTEQVKARGVDVAPDKIADMIVPGKVAIRQTIEAKRGYTKQRANQIIKHRRIIERAPLTVAGQPAWPVKQLEQELDDHDKETSRNLRREP